MIQISPDNVAERLLRYVQIDTQSDPNSNVHPTTEKQKDLSKLLQRELFGMGITDAVTDEFGYVYATIPGNSHKKNIPVICFCRMLHKVQGSFHDDCHTTFIIGAQ